MNRRILIMGGVLAVLLTGLLLRMLGGERTITLDLIDVPIGQAIQAIERQGNVRIHTNLDLETRVTLRLRKASVIDAIDTLAIRTDAGWQAAYLLAPNRAALREAIAVYERNDEAAPVWKSHFIPVSGMFGAEVGGDPRGQVWNVTPMAEGGLQDYLGQAAQKTTVLFAAPEDWNPGVSKTPKGGPLRQAVPSLARSVGGAAAEVFLISGRRWNQGGEGGRGRAARAEEGDGRAAQSPPARPRGLFVPAARRGSDGMNEEWMAERVTNLVAQLPPQEQAELRAELDGMRQLWESVRELPPDERREKMREMFNDPNVQDRMAERMARRDARRSPEQRETRYRRHVERKVAHRQEAGRPMEAGR